MEPFESPVGSGFRASFAREKREPRDKRETQGLGGLLRFSYVFINKHDMSDKKLPPKYREHSCSALGSQ